MNSKKYLDLASQSFGSEIHPCNNANDPTDWARFGFFALYNLYRMVRSNKYRIGSIQEITKPDGSPVTQLEAEMEDFVRSALDNFYKDATFVGEESGGEIGDFEYFLVLDPIDGTRNFLSGFETYCITLAILQERRPVFSAVCAPSTGDMYFRIAEEPSMAIRISRGKANPEIRSIPFFDVSDDTPILVNMHPSVRARTYLDRLLDLWEAGEISLVKSLSGSPSLLMVEAAKTGTFYLNAWSDGPTQPFDLLPALHIIRGAYPCVAVQSDGNEIDPWSHKGLYLVGPKGSRLELLLERLSQLDQAT